MAAAGINDLHGITRIQTFGSDGSVKTDLTYSYIGSILKAIETGHFSGHRASSFDRKCDTIKG